MYLSFRVETLYKERTEEPPVTAKSAEMEQQQRFCAQVDCLPWWTALSEASPEKLRQQVDDAYSLVGALCCSTELMESHSAVQTRAMVGCLAKFDGHFKLLGWASLTAKNVLDRIEVLHSGNVFRLLNLSKRLQKRLTMAPSVVTFQYTPNLAGRKVADSAEKLTDEYIGSLNVWVSFSWLPHVHAKLTALLSYV